MESIYNFICKANKSVDVKDGLSDIFMQQPDCRREASTVALSSELTASFANFKKMLHIIHKRKCMLSILQIGFSILLKLMLLNYLTNIILKIHILFIDYKIYLSKCFTTSFATTSPLIKQGGTPGPGTVNCPV